MLVWKTETLSEYTGRLRRSGYELAREITADVTDLMKDRIQRRTPVSNPQEQLYPSVPGKLRTSIHTTPVTSIGGMVVAPTVAGRYARMARQHEAHVETDVTYAPFVEYDTGRHKAGGKRYPIGPGPGKKAIAFYSRKYHKVIVVAHLNPKKGHPGSKGVHMFLKGAASMTEPSINRAAKPALTRWWAAHRSARIVT